MGREGSQAAPVEVPQDSWRLTRWDGLTHVVIDILEPPGSFFIKPWVAAVAVKTTTREFIVRVSCGSRHKLPGNSGNKLTNNPTTCLACVVIQRYDR